MKKEYGIIFIVIVIIFSAFVITMQNNVSGNNSTIINAHYNKTLYITYYSNSNIQYSFTNNSTPAISFSPAITTTNIELNVEVNSNSYLNSFFTNLLSSNSYVGSIEYLTGTVYEGTTASAFNETIPMLFSAGSFGSTSFSLASRYTSANFNLSASDIYFYGSSPLMAQDTQQAYSTYFLATPQSFLYNSITYSSSTGFYQPTFLFSYYLSSSSTIHNAYALTFTDYTSFNLLIDGSNYTSTNNQVVISLPNGSYAYSFYINGNYSTILSDSISVYGAPRTINLAYGHSTLLSLSALIYIALSMILLIAIIRMSGNLFSVYGISSLFFLYIGYELKIQYFGITLIMTIITLLSGLFVYKVILE